VDRMPNVGGVVGASSEGVGGDLGKVSRIAKRVVLMCGQMWRPRDYE
jgi:hypothetical protein